MSKEIKIGIISVITLAILIWGLQYLKGKNLFKKSYSFEMVLDNVEGLDVASVVEINGLPVGSVTSIDINPENVRSMIVTFDVSGEFFLPKNTQAVFAAPPQVIGDKKIILEYDHICKGDCLQGGERLSTKTRGLLQSVVGDDEIDRVITDMRANLGPMMDTVIQRLTSRDSKHAIGSSINNLDTVMRNMAKLTENLNRFLSSSYGNMNQTLENLTIVSSSFAKTNEDMEKMITNFSTISEQLATADIGGTLASTGETVASTNELLDELKATVKQTNSSFSSVTGLLEKIESGQGTLGKLMNDPEIYNNLEATTEHLALLLQDLRLNPKRYVRLSVFGRKGNQYTNPEEDPAFEQAPKEGGN